MTKTTTMPFIYGSSPVLLPAAGTATLTITTSIEADFYCESVHVLGSACAVSIKNFTDDRQWFNIPLHKDLVNLWKPPSPQHIAKGSIIFIELTDLSCSPYNEIRIALYGYKEYKKARKRQVISSGY